MAISDDEDTGVPLIESLDDSDVSQTGPISKRKRSGDVESPADPKPVAKRKKKNRKPHDLDDGALDSELGVNHSIAYMDSALMADHVAQRTRRFQSDLSSVELEDCHVTDKAILNTTVWSKPRITDNMAVFLEHFAKPRRNQLAGASKQKGSPHTLVVAGAGLRAADLTRALRKFQTKKATVAKLFAKHIKLKEAIETTQKTRMNIGIGTPQRLIDLLDQGALSITELERIVVDASHIDQKKRGVMDMKETHVPLVHLLTRPDIKTRYGDGKAKIELLFY